MAAHPSAGQPLRVLYVLGRGRSGSTIFAQVLGALDGCFSAGEIRVLWDPVLPTDSACACGEPVSQCPVWSKVLARLAHVDREQAARWQREVVREAQLPRLLRRGAADRWPALAGYRRIMADVYAAIAEVTGCRTVIDSSKRPSYALVINDLPGLDPTFVQLVRDPRASAYSWRTRRHTGAAAGTTVRQRGALDATLRWDLLNLGAEAVLRRAGAERTRRLRYEDFAAAPREAIAAVAPLVGAELAQVAEAFVDARTVAAPAGHALAGNPSRAQAGTIVIGQDREWQLHQRPADRLVASAVALPLLRRYGYPLRPASSA